jgi:hypothetical protein
VLDGGGVLDGGILIIACWLIAGRAANDRGAARDDVDVDDATTTTYRPVQL